MTRVDAIDSEADRCRVEERVVAENDQEVSRASPLKDRLHADDSEIDRKVNEEAFGMLTKTLSMEDRMLTKRRWAC